jgi:biopolymer transport protein ExbD
MTPLIDVMLVLLIIFIITMPSQTHAVKIDNPIPARKRPPPTPPAVTDLRIDFAQPCMRVAQHYGMCILCSSDLKPALGTL